LASKELALKELTQLEGVLLGLVSALKELVLKELAWKPSQCQQNLLLLSEVLPSELL